MPTVAIPLSGAYLTDETRLLMVLAHGPDRLICEDVIAPADRPAPIVHIAYEDVIVWREVVPDL